MNDKQKSMLFEINKSFTTPGTTNEKGSGLGMILCKDFIENMVEKFGLRAIQVKALSFSLQFLQFLSKTLRYKTKCKKDNTEENFS